MATMATTSMKEFKNGQRVEVWDGTKWTAMSYIGLSPNALSHVVQAPSKAYLSEPDSGVREVEAKPDPSFLDIELIQEDEGAYTIQGTKLENICVTDYPIGHCCGGWKLSKYVFDDNSATPYTKFTYGSPTIFSTDGTKVIQDATHARFVKIN